jgi:sporulation protein YlmC with PRC-barrel domain
MYESIGKYMKTANKIDRKFNFSVGVAALCLVASGWIAAQAQPVVGPFAPQPPPPPLVGNHTAAETAQLRRAEAAQVPPATENPSQLSHGSPMKLNKCSQLVGTAVENRLGDKLGKIDEVVVDFDSGRVSYCVLRVDRGIVATTKCLAVPLRALKPSEDGSRLILDATKDKVAQAQGFDPNNWPSVSNPAWDAQLFSETPPNATITEPLAQDKSIQPRTSQ